MCVNAGRGQLDLMPGMPENDCAKLRAVPRLPHYHVVGCFCAHLDEIIGVGTICLCLLSTRQLGGRYIPPTS
jgi:hypothetical protein